MIISIINCNIKIKILDKIAKFGMLLLKYLEKLLYINTNILVSKIIINITVS